MILKDKIPNIKNETHWENCIIYENREELLSLKDFRAVIVEPIYYQQGISGAINDCLVRESLIYKLIETKKLLPTGYNLKVFDAYRPIQVQEELFNDFFIKTKKLNPSLSEEDLVKITKKYIGFPTKNNLIPPLHATGGAIDVTIVDDKGKGLNMGTEFNDFTEKSHTRYFEEKLKNEMLLITSDQEALLNRRLLYKVMTSVGFTNYHNEWWHYDYGNQIWATINKRPYAFYGFVQ